MLPTITLQKKPLVPLYNNRLRRRQRRTLHRSTVLFLVLLCFMAGLAQLWQIVAGLIGYCLWRYWSGRAVVCSALLVASCFAGIWRVKHVIPDVSIIPYEQTASFTAMVSRPTQVKGDEQKVIMRNSSWPGQVLVVAPLYPQYNFGDRVHVQCRLQQPKSNTDFDYAKYLARYHVYTLCYRPQLKRIGETQHWLFTPLYRIRTIVQQQVRRLWPEPVSSLIQGVLLGLQNDIPQDINDLFRRTGTIHILVVSGMHVMLLAQLLERVTKRWLTLRQRFVLLGLVLGAFCIITGLAASVIRASLMGLIIPLAQLAGRPRRAHITLALVAAVMAAHNPFILLNDLGFQLSFLATIGLIYFQTAVARITRWLPNWFSVRETVSTSIAAALPTAPLIAWQFGTFSPVSFFANIIVLPVSNGLLFVGSAITGLSFILPRLAQLLAFLLWRVTWLMLQAQQWLSALPGAYIENLQFSNVALIVSYSLIASYILWRSEQPLFAA